jgi:hypothetical protein
VSRVRKLDRPHLACRVRGGVEPSTHTLVRRTRMHVLLQLLAPPQLPNVLRRRRASGALPPQPAALRLSPLAAHGVRQRHVQRAVRHQPLLDRTLRALVPQRRAPAALKPRPGQALTEPTSAVSSLPAPNPHVQLPFERSIYVFHTPSPAAAPPRCGPPNAARLLLC